MVSARGARAGTTIRALSCAVAVALIALQWVNTRVAILRVNQVSPHPVVLSTYAVFHSMAQGLKEGRIGQVDLAVLRHQQNVHGGDASAPFDPLPAGAAHEWVNYYTLDVGYSFIVEAARLLFPTLPDNHLRALALQLAADAALVVFVRYLFAQWHAALGLLAAYLYASNAVFNDLVSFAFYYYWDVPLTFIVLGSLLLAYRRPAQTAGWLTLGGLALGFGVWLRGSWWPLSVLLAAVVLSAPALRRKMAYGLVAFAVLAVPAVARASAARGQLTFTTRAVWHVALVGLGYHPNPYGLQANDNVIFELTHKKYGVEFRREDYWAHDQAAKREFLDIWHRDRRFVIRSFAGRLKQSVLGSTDTSVLSFLFFTNPAYRVVCLFGFIAMLIRDRDRRLVAIAAAGTYSVYVVLTSVFYFVGLAYNNVSEVTLFLLFIGAIDAAAAWSVRGLALLPSPVGPLTVRIAEPWRA